MLFPDIPEPAASSGTIYISKQIKPSFPKSQNKNRWCPQLSVWDKKESKYNNATPLPHSPLTQQKKLLQDTTRPVLADAMDCKSGSVFAFGITNLGKRYTITERAEAGRLEAATAEVRPMRRWKRRWILWRLRLQSEQAQVAIHN
jgi:hypothetical protein